MAVQLPWLSSVGKRAAFIITETSLYTNDVVKPPCLYNFNEGSCDLENHANFYLSIGMRESAHHEDNLRLFSRQKGKMRTTHGRSDSPMSTNDAMPE